MMLRFPVCALFFWVLGWLGSASATDWPRFRGPDMLSSSTEPIATVWPANGPPILWRIALTNHPNPDYSSFAVCGNTVFTLMNLATNFTGYDAACVALEAATGRRIWTTRLNDTSPCYSTPTVKDGRVYVYTGACKLYCLDAATGGVLWSRDLVKELGADGPPMYGNSQSPWVEDGRVFVSAKGLTNCLKAFDAANGALLWQAHYNELNYGSPLGATIQGVRQILFPGRGKLISVSPERGELLWGYVVNLTIDGPSPLVWNDLVISPNASVWRVGAMRLLYTNQSFACLPLWTNYAGASYYTDMAVSQANYLYGLYAGSLVCWDLVTGQVKWDRKVGSGGSLMLVDGRLLVLGPDGQLILAEASPVAYRELCRSPARWEGYCINGPAYSNGRLYVRHPTEMICYELMPSAGLQVHAGVAVEPNRIRLVVSARDGRPIDAQRLPRIALRRTTDLTQPMSQWLPVTTPLVRTNGQVVMEEVMAADAPARFYTAVETP